MQKHYQIRALGIYTEVLSENTVQDPFKYRLLALCAIISQQKGFLKIYYIGSIVLVKFLAIIANKNQIIYLRSTTTLKNVNKTNLISKKQNPIFAFRIT